MSDVQIAVIDQQDTQIVLAVPGVQGATGSSIPAGGTADQVLRKNSSTDYDANWTQVTSAMIADGTIVNADVNAGAAIAGTKISPDFGGQAVTTTGQINGARVNVTGNTAPTNGIYLPAANSVALSTNGTGRLFVDASGNVGVGVSPSAIFEAAGSEPVFGLNHHVTQYLTSTKAYNATPGGGIALRYKYNSSGDYTYGAGISFEKDNSVDGDFGSHITLQTRPNGGSATERLRITSAGLVGIGTSLPLSILNVVDANVSGTDNIGNVYIRTTDAQAADVGGKLTLGGYYNATSHFAFAGFAGRKENSTNDNVAGYLQFLTSTSGGTLRETMRLDSSGRLGIGTTSPGSFFAGANQLVVGSGSGAQGITIYAGSSDNAQLFFSDGTTGDQQYRGILRYLHNDDAMAFYTNGANERARIDSSGRLLVGTSSSTGNIREGQLFSVTAQNSGYGGMSLSCYNSGSVAPIFDFNTSASSSSGNYAAVASGRLLGTIVFRGADGTQLLEGAAISAVVDGGVSTNDLPTRLVFSTTADGASSLTERMRITNNGTMLAFASIGDAIIGATGSAAGSVSTVFGLNHSATSTTTGTTCLYVFTNGDVRNTNNSYGAISDIKLKENIVDANSQWDDIKALQVRKYNFKQETGHQTHAQIGLVAQEVELVSPGLVTESPDRDADGNDLGTVTKSVNYSVLYMKAVKALQEAMERIETLEARLTAAGI